MERRLAIACLCISIIPLSGCTIDPTSEGFKKLTGVVVSVKKFIKKVKGKKKKKKVESGDPNPAHFKQDPKSPIPIDPQKSGVVLESSKEKFPRLTSHMQCLTTKCETLVGFPYQGAQIIEFIDRKDGKLKTTLNAPKTIAFLSTQPESGSLASIHVETGKVIELYTWADPMAKPSEFTKSVWPLILNKPGIPTVSRKKNNMTAMGDSKGNINLIDESKIIMYQFDAFISRVGNCNITAIDFHDISVAIGCKTGEVYYFAKLGETSKDKSPLQLDTGIQEPINSITFDQKGTTLFATGKGLFKSWSRSEEGKWKSYPVGWKSEMLNEAFEFKSFYIWKPDESEKSQAIVLFSGASNGWAEFTFDFTEILKEKALFTLTDHLIPKNAYTHNFDGHRAMLLSTQKDIRFMHKSNIDVLKRQSDSGHFSIENDQLTSISTPTYPNEKGLHTFDILSGTQTKNLAPQIYINRPEENLKNTMLARHVDTAMLGTHHRHENASQWTYSVDYLEKKDQKWQQSQSLVVSLKDVTMGSTALSTDLSLYWLNRSTKKHRIQILQRKDNRWENAMSFQDPDCPMVHADVKGPFAYWLCSRDKKALFSHVKLEKGEILQLTESKPEGWFDVAEPTFVAITPNPEDTNKRRLAKLAITGKQHTLFCNYQSDQCHKLEHPGANFAAFRNEMLLTAGTDHTIRIWNSSGKLLKSFETRSHRFRVDDSKTDFFRLVGTNDWSFEAMDIFFIPSGVESRTVSWEGL